MIYVSPSVVLLNEEAQSGNLPVFGLHNLLTPSNIVASSAAAGYPASNMANPATFPPWIAADDEEQIIEFIVQAADLIDYVGLAAHNLGSAQIAFALDGRETLAQHVLFVTFDGSDAATAATDQSPGAHTLTFVGNAQLDTAQTKFGTASLLLDGTGDYVDLPASSDWNFGAGEPFTIHCWVRPSAIDGFDGVIGFFQSAGDRAWILQLLPDSGSGYGATFQWSFDGTNFAGVSGVSSDIALNTWVHLAATRDAAGTMRVFVNGMLIQATPGQGAAFHAPASGAPSIGSYSTTNRGAIYAGHIDQPEIIKGRALWTVNFTPPVGPGYRRLMGPTLSADDTPILMRFDPFAWDRLRVVLTPGSAPARVAVAQVGKLLIAPRGTSVDHTPINLARRTEVVTGRSEAGNFLGRIITRETLASSFSINNLEQAWYRANFDPFLKAARAQPFFFAWRPEDYPGDVGYCWLTNDPQPPVAFDTDRMSIDLQMGGVSL